MYIKDTVSLVMWSLILKYNIPIKLERHDLGFKYYLIYKAVIIEQIMQVFGMTLDTIRILNISIHIW